MESPVPCGSEQLGGGLLEQGHPQLPARPLRVWRPPTRRHPNIVFAANDETTDCSNFLRITEHCTAKVARFLFIVYHASVLILTIISDTKIANHSDTHGTSGERALKYI